MNLYVLTYICGMTVWHISNSVAMSELAGFAVCELAGFAAV